MIDSSVRILVVDADESCFRDVERCASQVGREFHTEWAAGYEAGVEALARAEYDVCLIDIRLAAETRESQAPSLLQQSSAPVILLAWPEDVDLDTRAFQAGAVDYLVRGGFDAAKLERAVRYAVERQRLVQALDRERYLLQTLMENLPEYIYFKDTESRFIRISRTLAQRLGLQHPSEAVGRKDADFFPRVYAERASADERELMATERPLIGKEEQPRWPDGTVSWVSSHKAPLRDRLRRTVGTFGISHDITEQKRVTEELKVARDAAEAANRAKSEFLANMSHEIRTPLNAVIGLTDLLLQTPLGNAQREYAQMVQESGEALLSLVDDVLDFAQIEAGRLELVQSAFDLRATLADTLKPLALRAASKGLDLTLRFAQDVPRVVLGDRARLRQVILNLVGNAVKFTEQGTIEVDVRCKSASADAVCLQIEVLDTGIGIPQDKIATIFRAFEQADPSKTRRYGGAGLGLAIALHLVELQGGEMRVTSEEGCGSRFCFSVPLHIAVDADVEIPTCPDAIHEARVLVVDPNPTHRQILHEMLTEWGLRPTLSQGTDTALQSLQDALDLGDPFRVVLADMQLANTDGYALADLISRETQFCQTSVILLASGTDPQQLQYSEQPGVTAVLIKPAKQSELFDAILASLAPRSGSPAEPTEARPGSQLEPLRVLLTEDSVVNQRLVVGLLERRGHHVIVANNGLEAVAAFRSQPFDLILMDVQMPELDGLQATAAIRQLESQSGRRTPIVALTAHALRGDREECLAAGMDEYLAKPIRADTLYQTIETVMRQPPHETTCTHDLRVLPAASQQVTDTNFPDIGSRSQGEVNWPTAFATVQGDQQLLAEIAAAFVADAPRLLRLSEDSIAAQDFAGLTIAAHTLKGTMRHFGAQRGAAVAEQLEGLSQRRTLETSWDLHSQLREHVHGLCAELQEYAQRARKVSD